MFFCTNCNNIYDITKIKQDNKNETTESEDNDSLIKKILSKTKLTDNELILLSTNQVINSAEFKKLSNSDKKKVKDNISEIVIPVELKAYFVCKNCGNHDIISPGTQIIYKNYNIISESSNEKSNNQNMIHVPSIPRTREYVCPNDKCKSHKDHSVREAVFFRINNTYKVKYVCTACETSF